MKKQSTSKRFSRPVLIIGLLVLGAGLYFGLNAINNNDRPTDYLVGSPDSPEIPVPNFTGAELLVHAGSDDMSIGQIVLKVFYPCSREEVPATQQVVIHEREAGVVFGQYELAITSDSLRQPEETPTCNVPVESEACLRQVTYSTDWMISPMPGGYDIVWVQDLSSSLLLDLADANSRGIALSVHLPDPQMSPPNRMPEFNFYDIYIYCLGQSRSAELSLSDPDGDALRVEMSPVSSWLPVSEDRLPAEARRPGMVTGTISNMAFFAPPPHRGLTDIPGFEDLLDPGAFEISASDRLGVTPSRPGHLLFGLTVTETRKGNQVGAHEMVGLIRIQP